MVEFNSLRLGSRKGSVVGFNYQLLEAATNKFSESNILGEGSSGPVYRASFDGKFIAAVKKVNGLRQDAERVFEVIPSKTGSEFSFLIMIIFLRFPF